MADNIVTSQRFDPKIPDSEDGFRHIRSRMVSKDGHPWRKACRDCAFRANDPQDYTLAGQQKLADTDPAKAVFICIHREDECGKFRVCASFAALKRAAMADAHPHREQGQSTGGDDGR